MVRKFGVSIDDEFANEIEADLEYQDNRSERIAELAKRGRVLEAVFEEFGEPVPDNRREARMALRQVFLDAGREPVE